MDTFTIRLSDKLDHGLKEKIFDSILLSGIYKLEDGDVKFKDVENAFFFQHNTIEECTCELSFIENGNCVRVTSVYFQDQLRKKETEKQIRNIFRDNKIKIEAEIETQEKIIRFRQLQIYLRDFKESVESNFYWFKDFKELFLWLIGVFFIYLTVDNYKKILGLNGEIVMLFVVVCISITYFIFIGIKWWKAKKSNTVASLPDPNKEAERIFENLND